MRYSRDRVSFCACTARARHTDTDADGGDGRSSHACSIKATSEIVFCSCMHAADARSIHANRSGRRECKRISLRLGSSRPVPPSRRPCDVRVVLMMKLLPQTKNRTRWRLAASSRRIRAESSPNLAATTAYTCPCSAALPPPKGRPCRGGAPMASARRKQMRASAACVGRVHARGLGAPDCSGSGARRCRG
jgi:hypothetical protein